jgi:CHAT domain-containing protein
LINIGYLYRDFEAYAYGLQSAERARALAESAADSRSVAAAAVLAAELERLQGHYDQALAHWQTALEGHRRVDSEIAILKDQLGIANVHAAAGRSEEARAAYFAIRPGIERSGQIDLILSLNFGIGDTYEDTQPDSSVHYYETALGILEGTRKTLSGDAARSDFLSGSRRYYYEEIARYYARVAKTHPDGGWSARSLRTVERAKARGLLDLLEASEHSKSRVESARDVDRRSAPRNVTSGLASIDDVRKVLPKDAVLLAYALGDSASLLWAIDRNDHDLLFLPKRSALQMDIQRLRDAIATPGTGDAALRKSARRLYESLVLPAESRLAKNKTLVIVPDGALFEVPFEVLLTKSAADETPWHGLPFLARSFAPVYAPSVSIYVGMEGSKKSGKHDLALVAVGDPDFSTLAAASDSGRAPLDSLPYTRTEVLSISASLKNSEKDILLGRDANEANVKETLRRTSPRLLHLATHGLVDPIEPAASSIALGTDGSSGEDGYLDTMEILSLRLDVDLVVLSACESARGRVSRSEGVVGLSRAFIASGAHGIVASLWAVSDESTSVLMDEFYKKMLGKKRPAGEALNEARFALMSDPDYAHPFYWSPFIVIGSERSPW